MHRIGILGPYRELPGELNDVVASALEPAVAWQVVTAAADSHAIPDLIETGDGAVLRDGIERMRRWRPDAISFACTSGSFVRGREGALAQAWEMAQAAGVPATSTSLAFADALATLEIGEVALVAPYPEAATEAFVAFLAEWGVRVGPSVALGYEGGLASETLRAAELRPVLERIDTDLPVLIPDTATWGFELHGELAGSLSQPLLTANQVTLWQLFAILGMSTDIAAFGALRGMRNQGEAAMAPAPEQLGSEEM
jgi:maleate cis-trans isomerase